MLQYASISGSDLACTVSCSLHIKVLDLDLQQGNSCYCLNQHGINYMERDSECNTPCSGDQQQTCGGVDRWMFYKIGKKS